ncbi:MAG: tetratricopeptide repeat protein [Planctomycetes bacterium]|nr:tetratricopeptide repeat protein [Planctomycetota bacterium]
MPSVDPTPGGPPEVICNSPLAAARALLARGKPALAAEALAQAAAAAPDDPAILCEYGIALKLAGRVEEARVMLQRAFTRGRDLSTDLAQRAGFILALTYGDQGDIERAVAAFEAVHALAPESALGGTALYYRLEYRNRFGR